MLFELSLPTARMYPGIGTDDRPPVNRNCSLQSVFKNGLWSFRIFQIGASGLVFLRSETEKRVFQGAWYSNSVFLTAPSIPDPIINPIPAPTSPKLAA
jgi:hypothetical protein